MDSVSLSFFTPIVYPKKENALGKKVNLTLSQLLLERVDDYFYLGGSKAAVYDLRNNEEHVFFYESNRSLIEKIALIFCYCLVLPLTILMLSLKLILRITHKIRVDDDLREQAKRGLPEQIKKHGESSMEFKAHFTNLVTSDGIQAFEYAKKLIDNTVKKTTKECLIIYEGRV